VRQGAKGTREVQLWGVAVQTPQWRLGVCHLRKGFLDVAATTTKTGEPVALYGVKIKGTMD